MLRYGVSQVISGGQGFTKGSKNLFTTTNKRLDDRRILRKKAGVTRKAKPNTALFFEAFTNLLVTRDRSRGNPLHVLVPEHCIRPISSRDGLVRRPFRAPKAPFQGGRQVCLENPRPAFVAGEARRQVFGGRYAGSKLQQFRLPGTFRQATPKSRAIHHRRSRAVC